MAKKEQIVLCNGGGCCPVVTFEDANVFVTDDFGGKIKLSYEQAKALKKTLSDHIKS